MLPPPHIVYNEFAHPSLVGSVTIEAYGVIFAPLHTDKFFTFTHILSESLCVVRDYRTVRSSLRSERTGRWSTPPTRTEF